MGRTRAAELRQLLNEWDFIGVFDPENNTDEYDCMITPLLNKLSAGAHSSDVKQFLDDEITGHFGMSVGVVDAAPMAVQLTTWWQHVDGHAS